MTADRGVHNVERPRPASARGVDGAFAADGLLRSKLVVPAVPTIHVARPRLHALLNGGAGSAVALVSAPAGWGKTVLVSSWIRSRSGRERIAWLSIEPGDDASLLWPYVQASLDGSECDARVEPAAAGSVPRLAKALERLTQPAVLILDDFQHVRDQQFLDDVEYLVRHAAGRLRLVIVTRVQPPLPLLRWRLAGDLLDIGPDDLAFTAAETAALLDAHGHPLPDAMVAQLHAQSGGWPAVLRLAALAINGPRAVTVDGVLAAAGSSIQDYLRTEVLLDQPGTVRDALLRTSILDRLYGGLVDAVTERADGDAVLAELARRNMFATQPGTHPPAHRYHRVLGEMMRHELVRSAAEDVAHLHRRAAVWHASAGLVGDALRHALAGGDLRYAARLATERWNDFVLCSHATAPRARIVTPSDEVVRADPELALACVAAHVDAGDAQGAAHYFSLADVRSDLVTDDRHDGLVAACAALRLACARLSGNADGVRSSARRLLAMARADRLGPVPREQVAAVTMTALGMTQLTEGDLRGAEEMLVDALVAAERLGLSCARAIGGSGLAFIRALRGELRASERMAGTALAVPPCPGQSDQVHGGFAYLALAMLDIEWNLLDDADINLRLAAVSCDPRSDPALTAIISIVRAQLLLERGDAVHAYESLLAGRRYLAVRPSPFVRDWYAAVEAGVRAAHGDTATVRQSFEPAPHCADAAPAAVAVAIARAYLADGDAVSASENLPRWSDDGEGFTRALRLETELIEAVAAHRRGYSRSAARMLEQVLAAAEPDGYRRIFVRAGTAVRDLLLTHLESGTAYWCTVRDLVDAIDDRTTWEPSPRGLTEALTDREVTVLRYLQSLLSNAEIASDMSVSVNTVKTHVRNIYRKLEAKRRRDAVARARQLRLI